MTVIVPKSAYAISFPWHVLKGSYGEFRWAWRKYGRALEEAKNPKPVDLTVVNLWEYRPGDHKPIERPSSWLRTAILYAAVMLTFASVGYMLFCLKNGGP